MRGAVVAAVVLVLMAAIVGAGYVLGNANRVTEMTTSTQTTTSTIISTSLQPPLSLLPNTQSISIDSNKSIGIDLIVGLNSTTLKQGQDMPIIIEVLNVLPRVNNVTVGHDFPVKPFQPQCDPGDDTPIDVEMYSGYYDMANISSVAPLAYLRSCPAVFSDSLTDYQYYLFEPSSSNATLYGVTYAKAPANSGEMSLRLVNQTSLYQFMQSFPLGVHPVFPVGVYTMVVQDSWGQLVISHFTVVS